MSSFFTLQYILLRRQGWPVAYLGQNVHLPDLATFIEKLNLQVVVLVAMVAETARLLIDWPEWITQKNGVPAITFAGRAFVLQPELKELVPGLFLGDSLEAGLQCLGTLLQ